MPDQTRFPRLRAAFRNAVVWAVGWGAIGTAVATAMRIADKIPLGHAMLDGLGMGIRIGIMGSLAGTVFFSYIAAVYRGKRLSEINWVRFGIGGAIVCGLFVPAFMQTMNLLTGGSLVPWHLVFDDIIFSTAFGGITAAGTMLLAQRYDAAYPVTVEDLLDRMERQSLGEGAATEYRRPERTRSVEQP